MKTLALTVAIAALLCLFGPTLDDHSAENAVADDILAAEKQAKQTDRLNQIHIKQCLKERGEGAAPVLDEEGNFSRCAARKGRS